jgi:predicted DNA-binding protein (MmcQ/YjbR family)
MDNERIREICLALPHVTETVNWGHHLVYWAGDRDIGGKMFAMTDLDGTGIGVLWFHCGAERFHELLERDGILASPYLAKAHWVTLERWSVLRPREIEDELKRAHALISEKLSKKTKTILALPEKDRAKAIRERKKALATKSKAPSKLPKSSLAKTPTNAAKAKTSPKSRKASKATRPAGARTKKTH